MTKHNEENEMIFLRPYFTHDGKSYGRGEPVKAEKLSSHDLGYAINNGYLTHCMNVKLEMNDWDTAIVREALLHERNELAEWIDDEYPFYGKRYMLIPPIFARPKEDREKYLLWQHKLDSIDELINDLNRALGIEEKAND